MAGTGQPSLAHRCQARLSQRCHAAAVQQPVLASAWFQSRPHCICLSSRLSALGAVRSSALTACIGADSGSAEGAPSGKTQRLSRTRSLAGMVQRRACAGRGSRAATARALHLPARLAATACKRSRPAAAQAAGVSVQEEQGAGGAEGLPALIPLDGALPCWQLPDEVRASAAFVHNACCSRAGKKLDCFGGRRRELCRRACV